MKKILVFAFVLALILSACQMPENIQAQQTPNLGSPQFEAETPFDLHFQMEQKEVEIFKTDGGTYAVRFDACSFAGFTFSLSSWDGKEWSEWRTYVGYYETEVSGIRTKCSAFFDTEMIETRYMLHIYPGVGVPGFTK